VSRRNWGYLDFAGGLSPSCGPMFLPGTTFCTVSTGGIGPGPFVLDGSEAILETLTCCVVETNVLLFTTRTIRVLFFALR
jgi:hypothetical protein